MAAVTTAHAGTVVPGTPMVTCEPSSAMVTALKMAEDGSSAVVLRVAEMHGQPTEAVLMFPWVVVRCEAVNPLEEGGRALPLNGNEVRVALAPHQVQTLKLYLA